MLKRILHAPLLVGLLVSVLGCAEETDEVSRKRGSTVERLDSAFEELTCPASNGIEAHSSSVEFARIEGARAKVDPGAAFRAAHALRLAAACAPGDEELRGESAHAYRTFRSQVAGSVLGASRTRATQDSKAERSYLVELVELLRLILPEEAALAERRIRQIDRGAKPR